MGLQDLLQLGAFLSSGSPNPGETPIFVRSGFTVPSVAACFRKCFSGTHLRSCLDDNASAASAFVQGRRLAWNPRSRRGGWNLWTKVLPRWTPAPGRVCRIWMDLARGEEERREEERREEERREEERREEEKKRRREKRRREEERREEESERRLFWGQLCARVRCCFPLVQDFAAKHRASLFLVLGRPPPTHCFPMFFAGAGHGSRVKGSVAGRGKQFWIWKGFCECLKCLGYQESIIFLRL